MTLILKLTPAQEAAVREAAARHGLNAEEYTLRLLLGELPARRAEVATGADEEWEADMQALSEGSERLPVLTAESLSRESIYGARG